MKLKQYAAKYPNKGLIPKHSHLHHLCVLAVTSHDLVHRAVGGGTRKRDTTAHTGVGEGSEAPHLDTSAPTGQADDHSNHGLGEAQVIVVLVPRELAHCRLCCRMK